MFKKFLASLLIAAQISSPAYALNAGEGFYFRYKSGYTEAVNPNPEPPQTKDITAYYIGGVNKAFSEKLPMKPQWEDDDWRITKGSLPDGLTFDSKTLTFHGTPKSVQMDIEVELNGFDTNNQNVASAVARFSIYQLPDKEVKVDFYNHKGQYSSHALKLPAGVVIDGDPKLISAVPKGVTFNARYFDGTPEEVGDFPVLAIGYDYTGEAVVAFTGWYRVEAGPTFATIPDDLRPLSASSYSGCGYDSECAAWIREGIPAVKTALKDPSKVRYFVEVQNGSLPGNLNYGTDPYKRELNGRIFNSFEQATIRYKAVDVDLVAGYSNWFKIGSLGPSAACLPRGTATSITLSGTVGYDFLNNTYRIPSGYDSGEKSYSVTSGALPAGLQLDQATGVITGKPLVLGDQKGVMVEINYPTRSDATPTVCGPFDFLIAPAPVSLEASGGKAQYRVGEQLSIQLSGTGSLIQPWTITMADGAVLPTGVTFNPASGLLSGTVDQPGTFSAQFVLTNGNGRTYNRGLSFTGHTNVDIKDVPAIAQIKQYDTSDALVKIEYDPATTIGGETFTLLNGPLPEGIRFDSGLLTVLGGTRLPKNQYGPFRIKLTDATGMSDETNDFWIEVTQRDDLIPGDTSPLTFSVNLDSPGQKPFSVTQPPLAKDYLPLRYTLSPATLPDGLRFNGDNGEISGLPETKSSTPDYTVTIHELSVDSLSKTSEPFSIDIVDPPAIPDKTIGSLQGNVGGPMVASASPMPAITAIRDYLVGFETSVVFDNATPTVSGLNFAADTGILSGQPNAEFDGTITINYHDGGNRPGKILVPTTIFPYPELTSTAASYELPRLADASQFDIRVYPFNTGFYKGVTYSLAPASDQLPSDLSLVNGVITGSTKVAAGSTYNLVVRGTSVANGITVDQPITLKIVQERDMLLDIKPDEKLWLLIDEKTRQLVSRDWFLKPAPTGSFVGPVKWSLRNNPSWMSISNEGQILGTPTSLGEWTVTVVATDQETRSASDTVIVKSSLAGSVQVSPGDEQVYVRQGETFETKPQAVTNVVNPYDWVQGGRPDTVAFDATTGVFKGMINSSGTVRWSLDVKDADGRKMAKPATFTAEVVPPLAIGGAVSAKGGKQYDKEQPIEIAFQEATNVMGKVTYGVVGDVPGTLYYKVYANDSPTGLATYIHYDGNGGVTTITQKPEETAEFVEAAYLRPDHMIFDTLALTLKGIPSRAGSFQISLAASDDHQDTGYSVDPNDPTKIDHNVAQSDPATVVVAPAAELEIANSADSEALFQYTSQPTLTTTVANTAYGLGILNWRPVSGTLPSNVVKATSAGTLGYAGYPDTQGTWNDIVWEAEDWAGRKIVSLPVSFTVGPRKPLQLVSTPNSPRPMIVFDQDADLRVTAKNVANGVKIKVSDWSISGADKLPPGVNFNLTTDGFHFYGTSDTIGRYSGINITARDSLGAVASIPLTFDVISDPAAIVLNVYDIKTKPGFPIEMQPPFASAALSTANTYGTVRFYSNDLPTIPGINLDPATGFVTGSIAQPRKLAFDLFVTDDTNRVTSKPVTAEVIPNLRLIVPTQVEAEQGNVFQEPIAVDYVLGKATYRKGAGNWPEGFVVDPDTGAISSRFTDPVTGVTTTDVVASAGTYPGLSIVGEDAFGTFTDQQSSNTFSIVVKPTLAIPDIADQSKTILGTVGTAITAWAPKPATGWPKGVVEMVSRKAWNYAGTVYSASHDLSQYGLTFNPSTGMISGTATTPFIIRDFVITVTSQMGDVDSTAPFWIGVAPKDPITAKAGQQTEIKVRVGDVLNGIVPQFDNLIGNPTFAKVSGNTAISVETATGKLVSQGSTSSWGVGSYPVVIGTTDEFGRTGQITQTVKVLGALGLTVEGVMTVDRTVTYSDVYTPKTTNVAGTQSFVVTGLPNGFTFNASTGAISGKAAAQYVDTDTFTVTYKVTDADDGATKTASATLKFGTAKQYWRILDRVTTPGYWDGARGAYVNGGFDSTVWTTVDGTTPLKIRGSMPAAWYPADTVWQISGTTYDYTHLTRDSTGWWRAYKFSGPVIIGSVKLHYINTWTTSMTPFRSPVIQSSSDGVTWKDEFSGYATPSPVGLDWEVKR